MLIYEEFEIKWHYKTREHFENLGYVFTKYKDKFMVRVTDLPSGSNSYVKVKCDYCLEEGEETIVTKRYCDYIESNKIVKKDACEKCLVKKMKDSNMVVFGTEFPFQSDEYQQKMRDSQINKYGVLYSQTEEWGEKVKSTNLEKFGHENAMGNDEVKNKQIETLINNYGVDSPMKSDIVKGTFKNTMMEKYGVEHPVQLEEVQNKMKETSLKNFGTEYPFQSDIVKSKIKDTMNERYGVENYSQTEEFKEKFKNTNTERYGVEYPLQNEEILKKTQATNLERYGVKVVSQNPEIKAKAVATLYKNGNVPTSSQQLEIYNMLKEKGYNVELNYPIGVLNLDVAIFIDNFKIDLEYDGIYFHQDSQKDRRRDEFLKLQDWKILRIRGRRAVPTLKQIEDSINKLITTDRTFTMINLDDVKEEVI